MTMSSRSEIDWLHRGVGRFFPGHWRRFVNAVPAADRPAIAPGRGSAAVLLAAYARLLEHPDAQVLPPGGDRLARLKGRRRLSET
nr:hypothetical protein [Micromonospora sp. KC207]